MKTQSISLIEKVQLSRQEFNKVRPIAGCYFDNSHIQLQFSSLYLKPIETGKWLKVSLNHFGVEAKVYISQQEAQRLLSASIDYFDEKYLSYLITQNLTALGVHFDKLVDAQEVAQQRLIQAKLTHAELALALLVQVDSLNVDHGCVYKNKNALPGNLPLNLNLTAFETALSTDELSQLSNEDVLLVYPK